MQFLSRSELTQAIRSILAEDGCCAAVAFWGKGAEEWLTGSDARVIANLRMGGTNPFALKAIGSSATIRQCDTLHAKVYLGANIAVVASANASVNGLGFQGTEQEGWIEAGALLSDVKPIRNWFESLWEHEARDIRPDDWDEAKRLWSQRQSARPPLLTFGAFDPDGEIQPVLVWVDDTRSWTVNYKAVEQQAGLRSVIARRRVDNGLEVKNLADVRFVENRWTLFWRKTLKGQRDRRTVPTFYKLSDVFVTGGFTWEGETHADDVMLAAEVQPAAPFDTSEPRFLEAFEDVIVRPEFKSLLEDEVENEPWYAPRIEEMRAFFRAVKDRFDELSAQTSRME